MIKPTWVRLGLLLPFFYMLTGCHTVRPKSPAEMDTRVYCGSGFNCEKTTPPSFLLGQFEDDYRIQYVISSKTWTQFPASKYQIVHWNSSEQYLLAQNDSSNTSAAGLWTRIDWMNLDEMAPYEWAFCISAFEEDSRDAAELVHIADRSLPKTGCNGHPFSRMKRIK